MSSEDGAPVAATSAHLVLGLPGDATESQIQAAYWRLRVHIEERARDGADPGFVARREQEIEELTRALQGVLGRTGGEPPSAWSRAWPLAWALAATGLAAFLAARLLLSGAAPPQPTGAAVPSLARLRVDARPAGASLEILAAPDDRVVETGPADGSVHELAAGSYRLRVDRDDCPDGWREEVTLAAGEEVAFAPRLCLGEGRLVVRSNVAGDRLLLDGLDVGSTGPDEHPLAVGDHEVRVEKEGFEAFVGRVRIRPDEALSLQAPLLASAAAAAPRERSPSPSSSSASASPSLSSPSPSPSSSPSVSASPSPAPSSAPPQSAGGGGGRQADPAASGSQPPSRAEASTAPPPLRVAHGGSKKWHDEVKQRLLDKYDADRSRSLDSPEEVNAIPCSEWRSIESSYETGGLSVALTRLYGFDGSDWVPGALGVHEDMRGYAFARMRECGLRQP